MEKRFARVMSLRENGMKKLVSTCALLVAVSSQVTAEQPYEVRRLLEQREEAIKKVNATAVKELELLKRGYMKKGDLVAANKAEAMLKKVSFGKEGSLANANTFRSKVVGKKWQWRHKNDKRSWFILKPDGTPIMSWGKTSAHKWILYENRTVVIFFDRQMAILNWNEDYSSFKGYQRDDKLKLYGSRVK